MSRRARAVAFGCAALTCAGLAASLAGGYRADLESQLGPLRPVVAARSRVPARRPLGAREARTLLEVRRIPQRFAPLGALAAPEEAIGRAPLQPIPPGAYLLAPELREPGGRGRRRKPRLDHRTKPVQISVTGAEALAAAGGDPTGRRVDVIVTTEPGPGGGSGRTYVAAARVELLALSQANDGAGELGGPQSDSWTATLGLTKSQALRLIQAQNFARQVRLIPH